MNVQTGKKHLAEPLQVRVDDHGVIVLNLKRRQAAPSLNEPSSGPDRTGAIKARLDRIIDYLFDVS